MDEHLYTCLKKMECSAQGMIFDVPQPGSPAYKAIENSDTDMWKLQALIENLIWFRQKVAGAATRVYMQGKE